MRACVVDVHLARLERLLQLPPGASIHLATMDPQRPDVLSLQLRGIGPEVPTGSVVPFVRPGVYSHEVELVDWSNCK